MGESEKKKRCNRNFVPGIDRCLKKGHILGTQWSMIGTLLQKNAVKPCHVSTALTVDSALRGRIYWFSHHPLFMYPQHFKGTSEHLLPVLHRAVWAWWPTQCQHGVLPLSYLESGERQRNCGFPQSVTEQLMLQKMAFNQLGWTVTYPQTQCYFFLPLSLQKSLKRRACWNTHSNQDFKCTKIVLKCLNPTFWLSPFNNEKY